MKPGPATTLALAALLSGLLIAPRGAPPADDPPPFACHLPFPAGVEWPVLEGNDQPPTHNDPWNLYAFDFAPMPPGSPVCAAADGVVTFVKEDTAGPTGKYLDNNRVVLHHDAGCVTEYAHLQKDGALVEVGDHVVAGDVIGLSGNTGNSSAPHLHFGCRADKGGPSLPSRFLELPGSGVPVAGQTVRSANIAVRNVPGWRGTRAALDLYSLCGKLGAVGIALPLLDDAVRDPPKLDHPSITALIAERDGVLHGRKDALDGVRERLARARNGNDLGALAELSQFGPVDCADDRTLAHELHELGTEYSKTEGFTEALAGLAPRRIFRDLVAVAVKAEVSAADRFVPPKRIDGAARPDWKAAIAAWEKSRGKAPSEDAGAAIDAHVAGLRRAP